jgi:2-polyprenyl-3-methyl-5-hydroxy-6-metoxy-1,4-benzoquinol methylase
MNPGEKRFCGVCCCDTEHDVPIEKIHLKYEYFTQSDIGNMDFKLERCKKCGVVGTSPEIAPKDLENMYPKTYEAHSQVHREQQHSLPLLMHIRSTVTKPLLKLFFTKSSFVVTIAQRILVSVLFPRMFRGLPVLKRNPGTLLDVGCGDGSFLNEIREIPCKSIGVDISPIAVKNARDSGLNVIQGNGEELNHIFIHQKFDVVRCADALEHTTAPGKVLKNMYEMLNAGGELILCVPNIRSLSRFLLGKYWPIYHLPFHRFHFDKNVLVRILLENGFQVRFVFTKNTLQLLYGLEYFLHHRKVRIKIVNIVSRILFTPLDILLDLFFPFWGDSLEIHCIRPGGK